MVEFIFDLQRFDGTSSGSGSGSGSGTGASSGGSNAKTDGDNPTEEVVVWEDDWAGYETKVRSALATEAYTLAQLGAVNVYEATDVADTIPVSGHVNNVITNVDRYDTVKFVDLNLESFATFYDYVSPNKNVTDYVKVFNYVDLIFDTSPQTGPDSGTVTRLYLTNMDLANPFNVGGNFTPVLNFASGLNVVYNFDLGEWFGSDDLTVAAEFWGNNFRSDYNADSNTVTTSLNGTQIDTFASNMVFASRDLNNYITGVPSDIDNFMNGTGMQNGIYFYDTAPSELTFTQKTDKGLAITFSNGTGALVQYSGDFSPTFYFSDGTASIYNSTAGTWRTVEEAFADKAAIDTAELQTLTDTNIRDVTYTTVFHAKDWDDNQAFPASRGESTEFYGTTLNNFIIFSDALTSNIVDIVHEDSSHFDIVFDTGAVTRIEYSDIVSPTLIFADGAYVFDLGVKNRIPSLAVAVTEDFTAGFVPVAFGTINPNANATSTDTTTTDTTATDTTVRAGSGSSGGSSSGSGVNITQGDDGIWRDENGNTYTLNPDGSGTFLDANGNPVNVGNAITDRTPTSVNKDRELRSASSTTTEFEYISEAFAASRYSDGFITKVTAQDDIYLADTTFENVSDFDITSNYDIILKFDTEKQLRVRDNSIVSPVFHFADGTDTAYNWAAAQWVGVTDVTGFNNGVSDYFTASAFTDSFFRNVEFRDYIYISGANYSDIAYIDANDYYVNITLNTGTNIAVRNATEGLSPTFIFADGSTYRHSTLVNPSSIVEDEDDGTVYYYGTDRSVAEDFAVSKESDNVIYYTGDEDTVLFVDAALTDITAITNVDAYTIEFDFANGTTTTVDYWDIQSPLFVFTDGWLRYDLEYDAWLSPASGENRTFDGTQSPLTVVDKFDLSKNDNNTVNYVRDNDVITFTDATSTNIVSTDVTSGTVTFTFDNGATTTINYTSYYTPTILFAEDGTGYQYYYSSYSGARQYTAYYGTDDADTFNVSGNVSNRVNNAGAADTIVLDKNYSDVTYEYISASSYSPYIELGFGDYSNRTYTYVFYDADAGLTPNIVFADGTSIQYNTYKPEYSEVDNISISCLNDNLVYYGHDEDNIYVDTVIANVEEWGTEYNATLTFKTGTTTIVGQYDTVSPLFHFVDGTRAYVNSTRTWADPIYATDYSNNIVPLSSADTNLVVDADSGDTISISDAALANTGINVNNYGTIELTFDSDESASTTVVYSANSTYTTLDDGTRVHSGATTPIIALANNDTIQYNVYNSLIYQTTDILNLSRRNDNIVYGYARQEDIVNFTDAAFSNVTGVRFADYGWDIEFTFNTGNTTYIEFDKSEGVTPEFQFTDGRYRYLTSYSSETEKDVWQKYDSSTGTWQTVEESVLPVYTSADLAESADLWGDAPDTVDGLLGGGVIAGGSTLSDLISAPVDSAAVSFNADSYGTTVAVDFITANTAGKSFEHKTA